MSVIEHIKKKKERNEFILFILKINNKNIIVYIYIYYKEATKNIWNFKLYLFWTFSLLLTRKKYKMTIQRRVQRD